MNRTLHPLAMMMTLALTGLGACGGGQSAANGRTSNDASTSGDDNTFTPAPWPPKDICTFLTSEDVRTILPTAQDCERLDPLSPAGPDYPRWIVGARWAGSSGEVYLSLAGALTPAGSAALVPGVPFYLNGAVLEPVNGLGGQAGYVDASGMEQSLQVRAGSYFLELRVDGVTPDVPEAALEPLVLKALMQL